MVHVVSDTEIQVLALSTIACHGSGCTVAVHTAVGLSNDDQRIVISTLCE